MRGTKHKTQDCCKTLKWPGSTLHVGDRGLITPISTHHGVVPTFYFELKLMRSYLCWQKDCARTSVQLAGPGLSGVRIAGSGLITKVVLLLCDGVEIIYPCPGVYLISRRPSLNLNTIDQRLWHCNLSGDKHPDEGFMQEAQGWT